MGVSCLSCWTSYFRRPSSSTIFLPSSVFSGSLLWEVDRYTSSMACVYPSELWACQSDCRIESTRRKIGYWTDNDDGPSLSCCGPSERGSVTGRISRCGSRGTCQLRNGAAGLGQMKWEEHPTSLRTCFGIELHSACTAVKVFCRGFCDDLCSKDEEIVLLYCWERKDSDDQDVT